MNFTNLKVIYKLLDDSDVSDDEKTILREILMEELYKIDLVIDKESNRIS